MRLSGTMDSFMRLKERFIKNYAVLSIGCYLLGIGDRHLENFLIDYEKG